MKQPDPKNGTVAASKASKNAKSKKVVAKPLLQEIEFQLAGLLREALATDEGRAGITFAEDGIAIDLARAVEVWFPPCPEVLACLAGTAQETGTIAFYAATKGSVGLRLIFTDKAVGTPTAVVLEPGQVWRLPLPITTADGRIGIRIDGQGAIVHLGILTSFSQRSIGLARHAPRVPLLPIHLVRRREKPAPVVPPKPAPAAKPAAPAVAQKPAVVGKGGEAKSSPAPAAVTAPAAKQPAEPAVAAATPKPAPAPTAGEFDRSLESIAFRLSDFAEAVVKVPGAMADVGADKLSMVLEKHAYAWVPDRFGLEKALRAQTGHIIRMTLEGVVRDTPNLEVVLGFRSPAGDRNMAARPGGYSGSIRVPEDFASIRIGLRLAGSGSVEDLRIRFTVEKEVSARSRIELRKHAALSTEKGVAPRLRVALIADPFTHENFVGITDIVAVRPNNWRAMLQLEPPDFLFVESAWVGNGGTWANRIVNNIDELAALVNWCKAAGIPTVFWNKEDPVHFTRFLPTARLFDQVYTTCIECVDGYREGGIANVGVLPFSVNLATYNPIGSGGTREPVGVFAGSYYGQKYPERTADMERLLDFTARRGLRIFDRHHGSTGAEFAFPERFRPHIVGSATARQLDFEYKRGRIAINVNTVKDSRSMFARRVVELAATGTPTVSNYSAALVEMFGDVMLASDDPALLSTEIERLFDDDEYWHNRRLGLMRAALMKHTMQDRLAQIMRDLGAPLPDPLSSVCLVSLPSLSGESDGGMSEPWNGVEDIRELGLETLDQAAGSVLASSSAEYVAFRGPNSDLDRATLQELLRHQDYARADAVGLARPENAFRYGGEIDTGAAIIRREALLGTDIKIGDLLSPLAIAKMRDAGMKTFGVERLSLPAPAGAAEVALTAWPAESDRLHGWWPDAKTVTLKENKAGEVTVDIATDSPVYIRIGERHALSAAPKNALIPARKDQQGFALWFDMPEMADEQQCELHVLFFAGAERLDARKLQTNRSAFVRAPAGWTGAALALRIKGRGKAKFAVSADTACQDPQTFVRQQLARGPRGASPWLCISSVYPHRDNIYRNAFVHTRIRKYLAAGRPTTVVSMAGDGTTLDCYQFEGVLVFQGASAGLADVLAGRRWSRALIHIVSQEMLDTLDRYAPGLRKIVWIHAIETQRWYRRWYEVDFKSPDLERRLKQLYSMSDKRTAAVQEVYRRSRPPVNDCRVIFVSEWFRSHIAVMDVRPSPVDYRVIHNPIDTAIFQAKQKAAGDRFRWLSIRPYASRTYANDLTVAAILLLRNEPWFKDVQVTLVGRGPLFNDVVAPLRAFANVRLEERFLVQSEIAEMHAQNGIFLCPSRSDSQGVSLGEAMASGLVPVSSDVAAIPDFVPREWGLLAKPDDANDLARRIKGLMEDPDRFVRLSATVSAHMARQCGIETVIGQELDAILAS